MKSYLEASYGVLDQLDRQYGSMLVIPNHKMVIQPLLSSELGPFEVGLASKPDLRAKFGRISKSFVSFLVGKSSKIHRKTRFFGFSRMRLPRPRAAQGELRDAACRAWA